MPFSDSRSTLGVSWKAVCFAYPHNPFGHPILESSYEGVIVMGIMTMPNGASKVTPIGFAGTILDDRNPGRKRLDVGGNIPIGVAMTWLRSKGYGTRLDGVNVVDPYTGR